MLLRRAVLSFALLFSVAPVLEARIISYAPVTDQFGRPAIQKRDNRHYLLFETRVAFQPIPQISVPFQPLPLTGSLVLHDRLGEDEPQTLLPPRTPGYRIDVAAMQTAKSGARRILAGTDFDPATGGVTTDIRYLYSPDGGSSWQVLSLPPTTRIADFYRADTGGGVVRGRGAQIRIGNDTTPFVFAAQETTAANSRITKMYALDASGSLRLLATFAPQSTAMLIGSDNSDSQFLVTGSPGAGGAALPNGIRLLHSDGRLQDVLLTDAVHPYMEGWITSGGVYLESQRPGQPQKISYIANAKEEVILSVPPQAGSNPVIFAVPTVDFRGAWMIRRGAAQPTALLHHRPESGLSEAWQDVRAPEVEALHVGRSGARILIQVHRPRTMANRILIDPALAIWEIGTPAPARYDELFLNEGAAKAFVSLDVDASVEGAPFVFDSAPVLALPPPQLSASPGGADVVQEWGIVRASLHQQLVIPALARLPGKYGSSWKSDLVLQNSDAERLELRLRFADSSTHEQHSRTLTLDPKEVRLIPDALHVIFGITQGNGALFLTPPAGRSVAATSRTYNDTGNGTYGMAAGANDVYAASSARFFLTYAGAFQGQHSRTNLLITDAGGRGTRFGLKASGPIGTIGRSDVELDVPAGGQLQINDVASWLSLGDQRGALRYETRRGYSIASLISIDNKTNDPTLFTPDVAAGVARMIPIVAHLDGAQGSRFRTDLFLFNPSDTAKSVFMQTRPLDLSEPDASVSVLLLPHESKVIPDMYRTLFNRTGVGRLLFQSGNVADSNGIRVTARVYSLREDGGTVGSLMPALNAFQNAGPGESLEILGAVIDSRFRTNLALVDPGFRGNAQQRVRVEIFTSGDRKIDTFDVQVPTGGGTQITDIFTARNLAGMSNTPVILKVTPSTGQISAFATMIDNKTNDPAYLGAGLSAQP